MPEAHRTPNAADPVLLVRAFSTEAWHRQHRHQRVQLCPQRLHVRDHPELGEPADVGVVDELRVCDHRPAVARAVVPHHIFDRIQRLTHRRIADRVDVDLQAQVVDPTRGLGQRVALPVALPVVVQRRCSTARAARPVSFSTTPSAKNFTVCAVSSGEPDLVDAAARIGVSSLPANRSGADRRRSARLNRIRSASRRAAAM